MSSTTATNETTSEDVDGPGDAGLSDGGPSIDRENLVRRIALGLTILTVVAGSVVVSQLGTGSGGQLREAEELVQSLHETQDVQRAMDRIVPGSLGQISEQQLAAALQPVLAGPGEIQQSELVTVRGVNVARIQTAGLEWCVTPDQQLLIGCLVGSADLQGTVNGAPVEVGFAGLDVFANRIDLAVVLATQGEPVTLGTDVQLEQPDGAAFERIETSYVAGGQRIPVQQPELTVRPDAGLLLIFEATDVADAEALVNASYGLTWDGGSVTLELANMTWFVE